MPSSGCGLPRPAGSVRGRLAVLFLDDGWRRRTPLFEGTHRRGGRITVQLELCSEPVFAIDEVLLLFLRLGRGVEHREDLLELGLHLGEVLTNDDGIDLLTLRVLLGEDEQLVLPRLGEA